jgi:hypothetical protein
VAPQIPVTLLSVHIRVADIVPVGIGSGLYHGCLNAPKKKLPPGFKKTLYIFFIFC